VARRVTTLSDLRKAGRPADRPADVPQGGTWVFWLVLVGITVLLFAPVYIVVGLR
jgi:hypothetical protein